MVNVLGASVAVLFPDPKIRLSVDELPVRLKFVDSNCTLALAKPPGPPAMITSVLFKTDPMFIRLFEDALWSPILIVGSLVELPMLTLLSESTLIATAAEMVDVPASLTHIGPLGPPMLQS